MEPETNNIIVLGAIKSGARNFAKIKKVTKIDPEELNKILEILEKRGFIQVKTKERFFGKKIEIFTTEKGDSEVDARIHELQQNWNNMVTLWKSKSKEELQKNIEDNKSFFPMMMFFGIIDMMMFTTMFSFIGASMTDYVPADQAIDGTDGAEGGDLDDGGFDIDIGF